MQIKRLFTEYPLFSLAVASFILLFCNLGSHAIWTQEHRWADIVYSMFYYHDFLHPNLNGNEYYDKPLLSYWLIAVVAFIKGELTTLSLRIPSACAGAITLVSVYKIGAYLRDRQVGILAAWMLLTTYFFIFWAHVSSADMLNLAGTFGALAWFIKRKDSPSFIAYFVFFLIVAGAALCKGLIAPCVVFIAILIHLFLEKNVKKYFLDARLYLAFIAALIVYSAPFIASLYWGRTQYHSNGFLYVYRENILRYFNAFDHIEPFYLYFYYLPIYLLPWTFFFFLSLYYYFRQKRYLDIKVEWLLLSLIILFMIFTLSESRRGYYVLPLLPFSILLTAEWVYLFREKFKNLIFYFVGITYLLLSLYFVVLQPLYYAKGGAVTFDRVLKTALKQYPERPWQFSLLDAQTRITYYLHLPPDVKNFGIQGVREQQTLASLQASWPILRNIPPNTIFVTRKLYLPILKNVLSNFEVVQAEPTYDEIIFHREDKDAPIAFIPKKV